MLFFFILGNGAVPNYVVIGIIHVVIAVGVSIRLDARCYWWSANKTLDFGALGIVFNCKLAFACPAVNMTICN